MIGSSGNDAETKEETHADDGGPNVATTVGKTERRSRHRRDDCQHEGKRPKRSRHGDRRSSDRERGRGRGERTRRSASKGKDRGKIEAGAEGQFG